MFTARQGDVLIIQVDAIPAGVEPEKGPVILAHGEATGHAHRIKARSAKMLQGAGARFLKTTRAVVLEHEEHAPIEIPAGTYQVIRQREYSPEAIRNVVD